MRRLIDFACCGETLLGTLDMPSGSSARTGLLIVSGGNEIRIGAHRGMALLADRLASGGFPVFRFDRRGIGDSGGTNGGFETSGPDIAAAAACFRNAAQVDRILGFGNCDAASALMLFHRDAGIDGLVLANPWAVMPRDDLPPPAAIRARYAARLRDPKAWVRLLRGGVDLGKLVRGLARISRARADGPEGNILAARLAAALSTSTVPTTLLLATRDNSAIAFADILGCPAFAAVRERLRCERLDSASHSFAGPDDGEWLHARLIAALASLDRMPARD